MRPLKFRTVKVMGERASGTNVLSSPINANLGVRIIQDAGSVAAAQFAPIHQIPQYPRHHVPIAGGLEDSRHEDAMGRHGGWTHAALTDRVLSRLAGLAETLFLRSFRHSAFWLRPFGQVPFHGFSGPGETLGKSLATRRILRSRGDEYMAAAPGPGLLWLLKVRSCLDKAIRRATLTLLGREAILRDHGEILTEPTGRMSLLGNEYHAPVGCQRAWHTLTDHPRSQELVGRESRSIRAALRPDPWSMLEPGDEEQIIDQIGAETISEAGYRRPGESP
ncbi:MAG: hypothetical protein AAGA26_02625 [Pseudomonadota bacterium]